MKITAKIIINGPEALIEFDKGQPVSSNKIVLTEFPKTWKTGDKVEIEIVEPRKAETKPTAKKEFPVK